MNRKFKYIPEEYWERRLAGNFTLGGVGNLSFGTEYNKWLYRARIRTLKRLLNKNKIDLRGKRLLEIGSGTGFYIDYWKRWGISDLTGIDITQKSVKELSKKYPELRFIKEDIASKVLSFEGKFDIITIFDVLFHIVDEEKFNQVIKNLKKFSHQGTLIFITDCFLSNDFYFKQSHVKIRSLNRYLEALKINEIKVIEIRPTFYFMSNPIDRYPIKNIFMRKIIFYNWLFISKAIWLFNKLGCLGKMINFIIGASLYYLDGIILKYRKEGPSDKLMLAEKL